ncbi:MAG: ArnT family glycosyltransferase [bacterium]
MPRGRILLSLMLFCLVTQIVAMARVRMPSQDGLKFIEIAREFGSQPAWNVIRSADQHPLYPICVNRVHALLGQFSLASPVAWRISAQLVSVLAMLASIWPVFSISRRLAGESAGLIAAFVWLLLPLPVSLGHETLSDALALAFGLWALEFGLLAAESSVGRFRIYLSIASAACVAAAYWTRPEGLLAGVSLSIFQVITLQKIHSNTDEKLWPAALATLASGFIMAASVMSYQWVNGSISDRLASPHTLILSASPKNQLSHLPKGLPQVLRDASLDFSPKDTSREVRQSGITSGLWRMLVAWSEGLGIVLAVLCLSYFFRMSAIDRQAIRLVRMHLALLLAVLAYQSIVRGYLSERHMLMVIGLSLPYVAGGLMLARSDISRWAGLSARSSLRLGQAGLALLLLVGVYVQFRPEHQSRLPHHQAGQWLKSNSPDFAAVFDTRGWASFEANRRRYDPYHMAQA